MAYSTIPKGSLYMNTKLYTGNGSTQSITGVGFKPDWVWVKQRGGTTNHKTSDIVRGVTLALQPNDADAEATDSNGKHLLIVMVFLQVLVEIIMEVQIHKYHGTGKQMVKAHQTQMVL